MFARDVEMFIEHCENKGLAKKTIGSYEQTLRLLMLWLDEQGITQTEKITHVVIQDYKPSAHMELDSTKVPKAKMEKLLNALYGTANTAPYLPMPDEVIKMMTT